MGDFYFTALPELTARIDVRLQSKRRLIRAKSSMPACPFWSGRCYAERKGMILSISLACESCIACQRSQSSCNPSQKSAGIPKTRANRSAVSDVTPRRPRITSFKRGNEMPSRETNSTCVIPNGLINSSSNISPGWLGGRWSGNCRAVNDNREPARCFSLGGFFLVIVRDFDVARMVLLDSSA